MADEKMKLENQICFSLYAATREMTKMYRPLLADLNITYPQYLVLLALWEESPLTVKELGRRLYLDSGTLTPMLKRMESEGLIRRERSTRDERSVDVVLTDKGKEAEEKAECIPDLLLERLHMEEADILQLKETLQQLLPGNQK
ncbi:MarR family transcriptional regulator [Halobacillus sp. ACCC02827]|uniref:MarR family winged helix-turn-helix transcriptional regulator n=1 Tax=Bacillaceae TaxID=186817 RepID=UPI0002A4EB1C|nr:MULTISPECIES: MarR family transcriptional regulator [Bacillaceae]ELK46730.1 transcriptional regulator [Halobacillus sp. BAB-2008]QHT48465.1 MarR family transcriptional regulator [Bacillus sp. SB49]WJE15702.1 MarR family transcriptional regulator [Halobacillus sp. ACCC02827]